MDSKVSVLLEDGPHPLKWGLAMLVLFVVAIVWHSVVVGILTGIAVGAYFGNYRGRAMVMEAWRLQMDIDHAKHVAELGSLYGYGTKGVAGK